VLVPSHDTNEAEDEFILLVCSIKMFLIIFGKITDSHKRGSNEKYVNSN